jgi:hypothetical protein
MANWLIFYAVTLSNWATDANTSANSSGVAKMFANHL